MNIITKYIKRFMPVQINIKIFSAVITLIMAMIQTLFFNIRASRGPLFVTWLVTFDCNISCKFCSTHTLKKKYPEEISHERAITLAHEIGKAKTWVVGFTGGEVLMWPHLFDVIKILKQYNIIVYIVTNGKLLRQYTDDIISSGVDSVVVSIDSDEAKEHDNIRNNDGLFDKLIDGIMFLKSNRQDKKPIIKVTTVLSKISIPKMSQIIEKLTLLADIVSFQPIVGGYEDSPHGQSDDNLKGLKFSLDERSNVEKLIQDFFKTNPSYNTNYYSLISMFWFDKEMLIKKIKCWSPFLRLSIMPNGDIFQCVANPRYVSLGNINEMSFMDVWNSNEMIRQREEIRMHKNGCICWTQDTSFNALADSIPFINKLPVFNKRED